MTSTANLAFVELNPAGDRIEIHFRYNEDFVASIKEVPGARYISAQHGGPMWTAPLSLDICKRLREEFGSALLIGRALNTWAREMQKREGNLHKLAALDDVPIKDLKIGQKLPELAEWFRPYQRADVKFLADTNALNINEQGLGKTTEIIGAIFEADLEHGPHLVVAPKTSLDLVWRYEIERWTANIEQPHEVITYHGDLTARERQGALDEFQACLDDDWPVWFVCTPDTVRAGKQPKIEWASFVIDEYHKTGLLRASGTNAIKHNSKFTLATRTVKSKRRYAMTGTPMDGKPIKLWSGLNFLYPEQYTARTAWAKTWLEVENNGFGDDVGDIQRGREDEFYKAIAPYVVRRLKSEVLPQLPPKQYIDVWCEMTPKQRKQYEAMAAKAELEIDEQRLNALGVLATYTRLKIFADAYCDEVSFNMVPCTRCKETGTVQSGPNEGEECQVCEGTGKRRQYHLYPSMESGKLPYLMERLAEAGIDPQDMSGDKQAIVATQFKEVAKMVHTYLDEKGIKCELISGDTKQEDRNRIQAAFQAGGPNAPRVVVLVTTAGGVAITLDRADTVHILDETWSPGDQEQLEDRAHRASRMHQVTVYYYRSLGTVEEQIQKSNIDKKDINHKILDLRRQGFRATMKAAAMDDG